MTRLAVLGVPPRPPGIVAAVTGVLADDSGNVEDTSMTSGARGCNTILT
jgi:hypothetical protein